MSAPSTSEQATQLSELLYSTAPGAEEAAAAAAETGPTEAVPSPRHLVRRESIFTPPGSPTGLHKELSVKELYRSARASFGGGLQPRDGELFALEHPVRQGPNRMVTEQNWTVTAGTSSPVEDDDEEPWRPPSPQPSPPRVRSSFRTLPSLSLDVDQEEEEDEEEEEEAEEVSSQVVGAGCGTAFETTVVASAPGKVILFGEHAVVYGKTAVGAAVSDLRIVVSASCTVEPSLVLELPDLGVSFRRTAQQVAAAFGFSLAVAPGAPAAPPGLAHLDLISSFLEDEEEAGWSPEGKKALEPLVFLVLALVPNIFLGKGGSGAQGLSLTVFSASLPVGAGLGSSAALCVATSAALTRLADIISRGGGNNCVDSGNGNINVRRVSGHNPAAAKPDAAVAGAPAWGEGDGTGESGCVRPSKSELERINAWAFAGETVLHGTPSGLDNTVSCYGGAIKFVKAMDGAGNTTEPIPGFPPLPILLTNTLVPKNTRALVAGVRRLLEAHRAPTSATFDAIGAIAAEFLERAAASVSAAPSGKGDIESEGCDGDAVVASSSSSATAGSLSLTAECVGELAEMNHRLLCALGVGHPALERVCEVASAHGCRSKLTGAGGGGCALTILSGADLCKESLLNDMSAEGFKCYETSLGGEGVLWHGDTIPPDFEAAAGRAGAAAAGGEGAEAESAGSGRLSGRFTGMGMAAAVATAVAVAAPCLFEVVGRRGSRC